VPAVPQYPSKKAGGSVALSSKGEGRFLRPAEGGETFVAYGSWKLLRWDPRGCPTRSRWTHGPERASGGPGARGCGIFQRTNALPPFFPRGTHDSPVQGARNSAAQRKVLQLGRSSLSTGVGKVCRGNYRKKKGTPF